MISTDGAPHSRSMGKLVVRLGLPAAWAGPSTGDSEPRILLPEGGARLDDSSTAKLPFPSTGSIFRSRLELRLASRRTVPRAVATDFAVDVSALTVISQEPGARFALKDVLLVSLLKTAPPGPVPETAYRDVAQDSPGAIVLPAASASLIPDADGLIPAMEKSSGSSLNLSSSDAPDDPEMGAQQKQSVASATEPSTRNQMPQTAWKRRLVRCAGCSGYPGYP